jgi:hypothetical protein
MLRVLSISLVALLLAVASIAGLGVRAQGDIEVQAPLSPDEAPFGPDETQAPRSAERV